MVSSSTVHDIKLSPNSHSTPFHTAGVGIMNGGRASNMWEGSSTMSSLQQQQQHLHERVMSDTDTILFLKDQVHRLNIELSRYQAKYPSLTQQDRDTYHQNGVFRDEQPLPPWLVNSDILSPLMVAYDERISEKQNQIDTFEQEVISLREKVAYVIQTGAASRVASPILISEAEGWKHEKANISEQMRILIEENKVLTEQQNISHDLVEHHVRLSKQKTKESKEEQSLARKAEAVLERNIERLEMAEKERDIAEQLVLKLQREAKIAADKVDKSQTYISKQVESLDDYRRAVAEISSKHQAEMNTALENIVVLEEAVKVATKENKTTKRLITRLKKQKTAIEDDNRILKRLTKKQVRYIDALSLKCANLDSGGSEAQRHLEALIKTAEMSRSERDDALAKAEHFQSVAKRVSQKLSKTRTKSSHQIHEAVDYVRNHNAATTHNHELLVSEIEKLRLRDAAKQSEIDRLLLGRNKLELELEDVWRSTSEENRRLKEASRHLEMGIKNS